MKNIRNIDGVDYIKLSKYETLEKKKVKIIKEGVKLRDLMAVSNPEYTLALISLENVQRKDGSIILPRLGEYVKFPIEKVKILKSISEEDIIPRIKVGENIYSYNYFAQAQRIVNAFTLDEKYDLRISKDKNDEPLLIDFGIFGIIISPRVETEDEEESEEGKEQ